MAAFALRPRSAVPQLSPWMIVALLLVALSPLLAPALPIAVPASPAAALPPIAIGQPDLAKLPLTFTASTSPAVPSAAFQVRGLGGNLFFSPREITFALPIPAARAVAPSRLPPEATGHAAADAAAFQTVRLVFDGANPDAVVQGGERQAGVVNTFLGNDPAAWRIRTPTYAGIVYAELYPSVTLRYDGMDGRLKGTYTVAPGADPGLIRWRYAGARAVTLDAPSGNLQIALAAGTLLTEQAPIAWQIKGGTQVPIAASYAVAPDGGARFVLGAYDRALPLIIDPTIDYSTYLGGTDAEDGQDIAVDATGNSYITGTTASTDFPTRGAAQPTCPGESCSDTFVTKLDPQGRLIYSTYLGGRSVDDGTGIAVDAAGNAFIAGSTQSADFPTRNAMTPACPTAGALCSSTFVAKLDVSGALAYSTYLGGSYYDTTNGIAADAQGNAHLTGFAGSTDFPTRNAVQPTCTIYGERCANAFVAKLDASGALAWSTFLGGGGDNGRAIAVGPGGQAVVTGLTPSVDFPTRNAFQPSCATPPPGYCSDAFVTKFDASGTVVYSTYLGGTGNDTGHGVAVDAAGNAVIVGSTAIYEISDFPTRNPLQPACIAEAWGFCQDGFVTKLDASGALVYSTYLGGTGGGIGDGRDDALGVALDAQGHAFVVGTTTSPVFPMHNALQPKCALDTSGQCHDAFVTNLDANGDLLSSTYLGGTGSDWGGAIAVDARGNALVVGSTNAADFPTRNAVQPACAAGTDGACPWDAFVTKITTNLNIQASIPVQPAPATSVVTATVIITNTSLQATPAVTLTLTEGDGMLHAPADDDSYGRSETRDGSNNIVHFDSGPFAPGEQKTFTIPIMLTPAPFNDPTSTVVVRSEIGAISASGDRASAEITATVTMIETVWDNTAPFDRIPGLPVADIGTDPDAPFSPVSPLQAALLSSAISPQAGPPSLSGNLWDFYLRQENFSKWSTQDKILYGALRRANISNRDAYAIVYVKALIGMAPSSPSLPGWLELRQAAWKLWWGIEQAKKTGNQDGIKDAFKDAMGALDTVNAQYFSNLLEFHDGYTRPAAEAVQDRFRTFTMNDRRVQDLLHAYYEGDVSPFDFKRQMPFASLVEYDVNYWLAHRRFPPTVHTKVLSQVMVHRSGGGADRNLAVVIADYLQGGSASGWAPPTMPRWTSVQVHSPLLPLVMDAQGRRAGVDARTGQVYDEIPHAIITPGHPWELAIPAEAGRLAVTYTTAYPFPFGIDVIGIAAGVETSRQSFEGTATESYMASQSVDVVLTPDGVQVTASSLGGGQDEGRRVFLPLVRH